MLTEEELQQTEFYKELLKEFKEVYGEVEPEPHQQEDKKEGDQDK